MTKSRWSGLDKDVRELQGELNMLIQDQNTWDRRLAEVTEKIRDLKTHYERIHEGCEKAVEKKDQEARSRTLLKRFEYDLRQMAFLDYCHYSSSAALTFEKRTKQEGSQ